jgi:hypothetical protein
MSRPFNEGFEKRAVSIKWLERRLGDAIHKRVSSQPKALRGKISDQIDKNTRRLEKSEPMIGIDMAKKERLRDVKPSQRAVFRKMVGDVSKFAPKQ